MGRLRHDVLVGSDLTMAVPGGGGDEGEGGGGDHAAAQAQSW